MPGGTILITKFMRKLILIISGLIFVILIADSQQEPKPSNLDNDTLSQLNSCASALYALARERFVAHEAKKETWILASHVSPDWDSFQKVTDGKYVIASIPVLEFQRQGLGLCVSQYNSLTTMKADLLALEGKYEEAREIYRLLQRFDNSENRKASQLELRIACVEKMQRNEDFAAQQRTLKDLSNKYGASALEILETKHPIRATNLFELSLGTQ